MFAKVVCIVTLTLSILIRLIGGSTYAWICHYIPMDDCNNLVSLSLLGSIYPYILVYLNHFKPWITSGIRISIRRREKLYRKFIKAKDEAIKKEYHNQYKDLRNRILNLCRQSKNNYYQIYFTENAKNLQQTWKGIENIININNKSNGQPKSIVVDNLVCTDQKKIANHFNDYFSTIADKLQSKIYHEGHDFKKYLFDSNHNSFFLRPTNGNEIIQVIMEFNVNKSNGPNSIPTEILHLIKGLIADPLSHVINLSFSEGIYLERLKISKTVPFFKNKGNNMECENYRPISLLSNINKIVEKLMHERLYAFLNSFDCIYEHQFGFRNKHSTNHALVSLTEDIRSALDNNEIACGVFIDLQKAFDTVSNDILLHKLNHYGIRGIANEWFSSYLSNRKQYVSINGHNSNEACMPYGVPQGSVLGPLLFLIYINDLHKAINYSKTRHFADDTNLIIKGKSPKKLQKQVNLDLRSLCNWLKANKISLNASKTELLIFRHPNKKFDFDFRLKIDGKRLISSKYVKYLGVLIDEHLNWTFHLNVLCTKLSRANGMLARIRHFVSQITIRSIYYGIFHTLRSYSTQIWGQLSDNQLNRIQTLQNKAIRIINFAEYKESASPLFRKSKILKVSDIVNVQNLLLVFDCVKGQLPTALSNIFIPVKNTHTYGTRGAKNCKILVPAANTTIYGLRSIKYQSIQVWNYMITQYSNTNFIEKSKNVCKRIATNHYIDTY